MSELEFAASSAKLRGTQMRSPIFPCLALLCATLGTAVAAPAEDGLYAVFQTSRGNFTAKLEFEKVPVTVANFVGLAEGSRPWLDTTAGALRQTPFYNGLTFHRVIPEFMIQSGSRNGLGTDGPGYTFGDEFHATLAHDAAGVLSMANFSISKTGKNSNGSQFFVTLDPTSWLDDKHSVFGRIVEGMDVVLAIGATGTEGGTPVETTTIENVTIVRNGAAAEAFSPPQVAGLPVLRDAKPRMKHQAGQFFVEIPLPPFSRHEFFYSSNLTAWPYLGGLANLAGGDPSDIDLTFTAAGKAKEFYRVVTATYPSQAVDFVGRTLILDQSSEGEILTLGVTQPQGWDTAVSYGTVSLDGSHYGNLFGYLFENGLNSMEFVVGLSARGVYRYYLCFKSPTEGWFTAQDYYATNRLFWPIFGTFRIAPLP
jgi:cyclophilin family peptidyl-prolyl cis-trans isomerase